MSHICSIYSDVHYILQKDCYKASIALHHVVIYFRLKSRGVQMKIFSLRPLSVFINVGKSTIIPRSNKLQSRMENITDISLAPIVESHYIRPQRMFYKQVII